jgi:hypothetical protein
MFKYNNVMEDSSMIRKLVLVTALVGLSCAAFSAPMTDRSQFDTPSTTIDFDDLLHLEVVTNQYNEYFDVSGEYNSAPTDVFGHDWDGGKYIGNESVGWDGSVIFDFNKEITQFGLDIIDGYTETLSVYDVYGNLIESVNFTDYIGFVGIDTDSTIIGRAVVTGQFYALDNVQFNAVPIPAAVWLFGSGLLGLVGLSKRRMAKA